jgi:hypothetical protein
LLQKLVRSQIAESLVRADGAIGPFPMAQFPVELSELQRMGRDLIKLLGSECGALDGAVELWRTRREHEQVQAALLAGLLEFGGKLGTAVDLGGANGKRHAMGEGVEEVGGGGGASAAVGLQDVPARDQIAGGELLEHLRGIGRTSLVSTSTKSPSADTAYCLGLRTA